MKKGGVRVETDPDWADRDEARTSVIGWGILRGRHVGPLMEQAPRESDELNLGGWAVRSELREYRQTCLKRGWKEGLTLCVDANATTRCAPPMGLGKPACPEVEELWLQQELQRTNGR